MGIKVLANIGDSFATGIMLHRSISYRDGVAFAMSRRMAHLLSVGVALCREPIDRLLCHCSRCENCALVRSQYVEPTGQVSRVVRPWFKCDAKVGAKECCTDLGDEFFSRVGIVAETLAEVSVATLLR